MKNFFKTCWIITCIFFSFLYLISAASAFIAPSFFSYTSVFAIAFPYLLIAIILLCFISVFFSKKISLLLLIIIFFGYRNIVNTFACNPSKWQQKKDDSDLRIMTWNVESFAEFYYPTVKDSVRRKLLSTIQQSQPDVLCFQEYYDVENSKQFIPVKSLLDSLGYHFCYFSNDRSMLQKPLPGRRLGTTIFSKLPFIDSGRINIVHNWNDENLIYTTIKFDNKPVRIFTAHLLSFALYADTLHAPDGGRNIYKLTYDRKRSILYKLKETEIIHEKEVTIIRKQIDASPYPAIYCGDMNTTPASYNYRFLKNDLQDAFLEKGFGIGATFYKILSTLRIDVCFADKKLKVVQCSVEEKKLSDHYPVITDLQWR